MVDPRAGRAPEGEREDAAQRVFDHVDQLTAPAPRRVLGAGPLPAADDDARRRRARVGCAVPAAAAAGRGGTEARRGEDRGAVQRRRVRHRRPQRDRLDARSTPGCTRTATRSPQAPSPTCARTSQMGMKFFVAKVDVAQGALRAHRQRAGAGHPLAAAVPLRLGRRSTCRSAWGSSTRRARRTSSSRSSRATSATRSPTTTTSRSRRTSTCRTPRGASSARSTRRSSTRRWRSTRAPSSPSTRGRRRRAIPARRRHSTRASS